MNGGCVGLGSPVAFDDAPRGTCNHYAPRVVVSVAPRVTANVDADRKRLSAQLAAIRNEHAANVWDPRMARSEGRSQ